jgi:hypothetical protein
MARYPNLAEGDGSEPSQSGFESRVSHLETSYGSLPQSAEGGGSNPPQSGFESRVSY